jgi:Cu(I)-responsive transcriptional regulator
MPQGVLTIGQLGAAAKTKVETIRYYERIGLLPKPRRTDGNYRSFAPEHISQLAFIRRARELGFSIENVRELLNLAGERNTSCAEIDRIARRHLATVETKISSLKRLRDELHDTIEACSGGRVAECKIVKSLSPDYQRSQTVARRPRHR